LITTALQDVGGKVERQRFAMLTYREVTVEKLGGWL
jgi:hypothetical protein